MHGPSAVRSTLGSAREFDASSIAPALQRRRLQCYLAQMVGDIVAVLLGFGFFGFFYIGIDGWINALVSAQMLLPVFLTIGLYNGAYSLDSLASPGRNIRRTTVAFGMSIVAVVLIAFLTKSITELSRLSFSGGAVCAVLLLIWGRLQMRSFIRWRCGANVLNQMVIDDDGPIVDLPGAIHISARSMQLTPNLNDPHALDRIGLVLRNIDRVVVSCPPERRIAWSMMLKGANIEGEVLDDVVARLGAQGARVIGNHGLLLVSAGPLGLRERAMKRIFDLAFAGVAVAVLSP